MKYVGKRAAPPESPTPAHTSAELDQIAAGMVQLASKRAQATAIARMAAMHDGPDGPEQQAVPLSDPGLMERIRHAEAKRPAIFGTDPSEKPNAP